MNITEVNTEKKYKVYTGPGSIKAFPELFGGGSLPGKFLIVSGENVSGIYGETIAKTVSGCGPECFIFTHRSGEAAKTPGTVIDILEFAAENHFTRNDCFVSLGGGVSGDICGLAASLYMRGVRYVQIPTSLLAMVDASVGGKTAVDLKAGKNLMGTFYQPHAVICDTDFLATLPSENLRDGMAEIIKTECISGRSFADMPVDRIVEACVRFKADIVSADEKDLGQRRLLNFGHTVGHALERLSGYRLRHGEAVAAGMYIISAGACASGLCDRAFAECLRERLISAGLPVSAEYSPSEIRGAALSDKKGSDKGVSLVLPRGFGEFSIEDRTYDEFEKLVALGLGLK